MSVPSRARWKREGAASGLVVDGGKQRLRESTPSRVDGRGGYGMWMLEGE